MHFEDINTVLGAVFHVGVLLQVVVRCRELLVVYNAKEHIDKCSRLQ